MKKVLLFVLLLIVGLVGVGCDNQSTNSSQPSKESVNFDVQVISHLNKMPYWGDDSKEGEAYFIIEITGINKESYNNSYELNQLILNGNNIDVNSVKEEEGPNDGQNGFRLGRFYSSDYKDNNNMTITFKNKSTNELYNKDFSFTTETVY